LELKPEIHLKQTQKLIMTPQLQQAIKMLQLSSFELLDRIEQELEENPALEIEERQGDFFSSMDGTLELRQKIDEKNTRYDEGLEDEYFFGDRSFTQPGEKTGEDKKREFIEGTIYREETLKEHLRFQLHLLKVEDEELQIAEALISYIDIMGYLSVPLEDISKEIEKPVQKVESALKVIQSLDPPGVGARDIKECLLIQLRTRGNYPLAEKIIKNHLNDVKLNKLDEIAKRLKVPLKKVQEAFSIISRLEPYPGRQFFSEEIRYIIPDVIVEKRDGNFEIISNSSIFPRLRVNRYYAYLLKKKKQDKRIKEFISEKVQRAQNFIRSIEQREDTLLRVTRAILEEQRDFFEKGPKYLKPLTLRDVAQKVDLHESTVSRITSSKYVQTPFGVFQLKYFFSNPIQAHGAREYSSTSIKEIIRDIIQSEGMKKHLSDQQIADILAKRGIKIARRTVAKYRKELKILPSNLRR